MGDQGDLFGDNLAQLRTVTRDKSIRPGGTKCPVCDQRVDRSRRRLHQGMVRILIAMHQADRHAPGEWVHLNTLLSERFDKDVGDGTKLRHWLLIEKHPTAEHQHGAKSAGMYRITDLGHLFVHRGTTVHSHGFAFNGMFALDEKSPMVGIKWCLGRGFDYDELMAETGRWPP